MSETKADTVKSTSELKPSMVLHLPAIEEKVKKDSLMSHVTVATLCQSM
jgi:hypothetical protein